MLLFSRDLCYTICTKEMILWKLLYSGFLWENRTRKREKIRAFLRRNSKIQFRKILEDQMGKKEKKAGKIIALLLILALTCGMGYVALFGIGEKKIGSAYNVKQGLDLAGGVSITYEIVGDEAPTKEDLNDSTGISGRYRPYYDRDSRCFGCGHDFKGTR